MLTGVGTLLSSPYGAPWLSDEFSRDGASTEGRPARLMGREKLVRARMLRTPPMERSELTDGDRGGGGGGRKGERGGVEVEKALPDESLRGTEDHDASSRPGRSSSGLSDGTDRMLEMPRANGGRGGVSEAAARIGAETESVEDPLGRSRLEGCVYVPDPLQRARSSLVSDEMASGDMVRGIEYRSSTSGVLTSFVGGSRLGARGGGTCDDESPSKSPDGTSLTRG